MAKVFIGVGHGGNDPGAVANGFLEKDLNLAIAFACREELKNHGVNVLMSRTADDNESLTEKINECNSFEPDLALDIHNNAGGGDGAEVFHHYKGGTGKTLANNILAEMKKIGQNSRGTKIKTNSRGVDAFVFIRNTNAPAVIVECAFVDNAKDIQIIDTLEEQKAMGVAIAKGVLATLGIKCEAVSKPVQTETVKTVNVVAQEVIAGKWGNGDSRKKNLTDAGYDYTAVQAEVNRILTGKKSVTEIAREVIAGKWGVGQKRKKRLMVAGYNYNEVQAEVNRLLK